MKHFEKLKLALVWRKQKENSARRPTFGVVQVRDNRRLNLEVVGIKMEVSGQC